MTGCYEWCVLVYGTVKWYPTAVVELDTPYLHRHRPALGPLETSALGGNTPSPYGKVRYIGTAKVLCMETPVQAIIVGNIPEALGVEPRSKLNRLNTTVRCDVKTTDHQVSTTVKPNVNHILSQKVNNTENNPDPPETDNELNSDTSRQS